MCVCVCVWVCQFILLRFNKHVQTTHRTPRTGLDPRETKTVLDPREHSFCPWSANILRSRRIYKQKALIQCDKCYNRRPWEMLLSLHWRQAAKDRWEAFNSNMYLNKYTLGLPCNFRPAINLHFLLDGALKYFYLIKWYALSYLWK